MKLFITHTGKRWKVNSSVLDNIQKLADYLPPENIIEISYNDSSEYSKKSNIFHKGKILFNSIGGEVEKSCLDELAREGEDEFIFTGGYFGSDCVIGCHFATFNYVWCNVKPKSFIFPLESISTHPADSLNLSNKEEVIDMIKKRYIKESVKAELYWDNEFVCETGKDHKILIFSTNEKLLEHLK